jgi:hypothetical protein
LTFDLKFDIILHKKKRRKVLDITSKAVEFIIRGTIDWCKLLGPARAYTGDPKFDKGPTWSVEINPDDASRGKLLQHGLEEKFKRDKLKKKDGTPTKNPRDYDFIRLNILENRADGKKNKPPVIEDAYKRLWDPEVELGNGTTVDILVRYVDYGTTKGLYYKKMRVLKLVPFEGGSDFEPLSEEDQFFGEPSDEVEQEFARLPEGLEPELDDDVPE